MSVYVSGILHSGYYPFRIGLKLNRYRERGLKKVFAILEAKATLFVMEKLRASAGEALEHHPPQGRRMGVYACFATERT